MTDEFGQRIIGIFAVGDTVVSTDKHPAFFVKDSAGKYQYIILDSDGRLQTRKLNTTDDIIKIGDGTSILDINTDGSINVAVTGASDSIYYPSAGVTLVKDTPNTVVTHTPASTTEYISAVIVSGSGYCEWGIWFGTTSSEAEILHFWTTPSHPTEYVDLPDFLKVTTTQTILVKGNNREKAASTASDFTGYATIVKKN